MPENAPATVGWPGQAWRIARRNSVARFSEIRPEDAMLPNSGNRFDVSGAGVLYAASEPAACFGETLARFRPSPKVVEAVGEVDGNFMVCGGVPADWRYNRVLAPVRYLGTLPFVDVEHPQTHAYMSRELASYFHQLGYSEPIDVSDIRGRNRTLTRLIAAFVYAATDAVGEPMYAGIRYMSRLDSGWECWALFDPETVEVGAGEAIAIEDVTLQATARAFNLTIF